MTILEEVFLPKNLFNISHISYFIKYSILFSSSSHNLVNIFFKESVYFKKDSLTDISDYKISVVPAAFFSLSSSFASAIAITLIIDNPFYITLKKPPINFFEDIFLISYNFSI